ncbi:hypothetical protein EVAR_100962_1 [Eumeta japonica]|uniref:Uncharacterized protein n=1 Tax=Eumeta variegata TaxID=151549 RepID=A0A4C2A8F9_EUMVA|nr:hypothetical protein EVAR_100962_1 [Eumeta japonica]
MRRSGRQDAPWPPIRDTVRPETREQATTAGRGKTWRGQIYACYLYGLTLPPDRTIVSRLASIVIINQIFV